MHEQKYEYISKQRALQLWDSGLINEIEVGITKGLQAFINIFSMG